MTGSCSLNGSMRVRGVHRPARRSAPAGQLWYHRSINRCSCDGTRRIRGVPCPARRSPPAVCLCSSHRRSLNCSERVYALQRRRNNLGLSHSRLLTHSISRRLALIRCFRGVNASSRGQRFSLFLASRCYRLHCAARCRRFRARLESGGGEKCA